MPLVLKNVNLEIDAGTKIGEVFFRISMEKFHVFYVKTMCKKHNGNYCLYLCTFMHMNNYINFDVYL